MGDSLTIALSKGRIYRQTLPLLQAVDVIPVEDPETSRKLIIDTNLEGVRLVIVRASDVPTYVQYGGADLGVVGKDVLLEHGGEGVYEPLDLEVARCKLMVAGLDMPSAKAESAARLRLRIASKYVNCARRYYAQLGQQVEVIKLYGSMELAPLLGMADKIVDVVDTGNTLRANGLQPEEVIAEISARLIVNKAAMKMKHAAVCQLIEKLRGAVVTRRQTCNEPQHKTERTDEI
jgi:ATP phosphoribosyltransferase